MLGCWYLVRNFASVAGALGFVWLSLPDTLMAQSAPAALANPEYTYRVVWETEYREQRYQVAKPVWNAVAHTTPAVGEAAAPPTTNPPAATTVAYSTTAQPANQLVTPPQQYTAYEPVVRYETRYVDQGQWVDQAVVGPSTSTMRLRWVKGGWTTDPATGRSYWKPGMIRPVREERPGPVQTFRVWQPNVVPIQVPQTSYEPRITPRDLAVAAAPAPQPVAAQLVPVDVPSVVAQQPSTSDPAAVRWVYEERVERVPVQVCRVIAVPLGTTPEATTPASSVPPPPQTAPVSEPPAPRPTLRLQPRSLEEQGLVARR